MNAVVKFIKTHAADGGAIGSVNEYNITLVQQITEAL